MADAVAIRCVAVPEAAPPYDDVAAAERHPGRLAVVAGLPRRSPAPGNAEHVGQAPESAQPASAEPASAEPASVTWPSRFAQVLAETLAGSRPPEQIVPWTTEQARKKISELGPLLATAHRPRVRRVIATSPAAGVLEMTVIVVTGRRVRALAVRLERAAPAAPGDGGSPADRAHPGHRAHPGDRTGPRDHGDRGDQAGPGRLRPDSHASSNPPGRCGPPGDCGPGAAIRPPLPARADMPGRRRQDAARWLCTAVEAA